MKAIIQNSKRHTVLGNADSNRESLATWLGSWRQRVGIFSIFAALPAVVSQTADARAQDAEKPRSDVAERQARFVERLKSCSTKPDFLRRQSNFRLPHKRGSLELVETFAGNDNCPGLAIPTGTYTVAAPYTDTGNTTGANNTVTQLYSYYGSADVNGPDLVYSFTIISAGASPEIRVTPTSPTYDPAIYVLDGQSCPTGNGNVSGNWWAYADGVGPGNTETLDINNLQRNRRYHLFIDSNGPAPNTPSSGPYTLTMQNVTIAEAPRTKSDFDGDGKADIAVFRPSDRVWYMNRSTQGFAAAQFGLSTDRITPADFDGDGKTDISAYRDGTWWRINSSDGALGVTQFGQAGDIPVPADYSGDGRAEIAVYRNGVWWFLNLADNQYNVIQFGLPTDKPVPADFDGDGHTDIAIFRPSLGQWWIQYSNSEYVGSFTFGANGDIPTVGDYDAYGHLHVSVFRPSTGSWMRKHPDSDPGWPITSVSFGISTDIPVPADYDGDGADDIAIYRNGQWWLLQSTDGLTVQHFGLAGDKPIQAAYLP